MGKYLAATKMLDEVIETTKKTVENLQRVRELYENRVKEVYGEQKKEG